MAKWAPIGWAMLLGAMTPASAQDQAPDRLQGMIADEAALAHVRAVRPDCARDELSNDIVVCAPDHTDRYRIPSTDDDNPAGETALRTGELAPPDVYTHPPPGVSTRMGYAPPPIYYFDITALPMPAPGTDADKIAKGEMRAP